MRAAGQHRLPGQADALTARAASPSSRGTRGFDTWGGGTVNNAAAPRSRQLQTSAPVTGGSTFTIRFTIWDSGNDEYDSTVLVDNFQWVATGGLVYTGTVPVTM